MSRNQMIRAAAEMVINDIVKELQAENARLRQELATLGWRRWEIGDIPEDTWFEFNNRRHEPFVAKRNGTAFVWGDETWNDFIDGKDMRRHYPFFRPIPPVPEVGKIYEVESEEERASQPEPEAS